MKYRSYLSHDTFMTPMLMALGLLKYECVLEETRGLESKGCLSKPPVGSAFVWELVEREEGELPQFFIRATYRGEYFNMCMLDSENADKYFSCPYDKFLEFINTYTFSNWEHVCEKGGSIDPEAFDYHKYNDLHFEEDDFWNGISRRGIMFGGLTFLAVLVFSWMCTQMFRYGMLTQQLQDIYTKLEKDGLVDNQTSPSNAVASEEIDALIDE